MMLADAHCHLQDPRIHAALPSLLDQARAQGVHSWIVNSTRETDWAAVSALADTIPGVRAAFGLHPWWQRERTPRWRERLMEILIKHPDASVGETGLDLWMTSADLEDQKAVLREHLEVGRIMGRPVSIHCLRAWSDLLAMMKNEDSIPKGFLLHSYAGPAAMVDEWAELGAFFSFSPAFLSPKEANVREMFRSQIPLNRILVETDAPDMAPPMNLSRFEIPQHKFDAHGTVPPLKRLNHPANLILCVETIAADRGMTGQAAAKTLMANFRTLFGEDEKTMRETLQPQQDHGV
jgi:TatD DNase family protein